MTKDQMRCLYNSLGEKDNEGLNQDNEDGEVGFEDCGRCIFHILFKNIK